MRNTVALLTALLFVVVTTTAWAQPEPEPDNNGDKKKGEEVELEPDPPDPDGLPHGVRENPDTPIIVGDNNDTKDVAIKKSAKKGSANYPIEAMHRPLTLFAGMSEVSVDVPVNADPFQTSGLLTGAYGITSKIQVGLRYGFGSIVKGDGYLEGKAFAIDGAYKLTDWASVSLSIPVLVDPFAMGVRIGVPVRFKITNKLAIVGGHDLLSISFSKFVPEIQSAAANAAFVALHATNTTLPDGDFRILGGVIYQYKPNLAILADIGVVAPDFKLEDQPVPLHVGVQWSKSRRWDFGARIGFENMDEAKNTFGLGMFAAFRI